MIFAVMEGAMAVIFGLCVWWCPIFPLKIAFAMLATCAACLAIHIWREESR